MSRVPSDSPGEVSDIRQPGLMRRRMVVPGLVVAVLLVVAGVSAVLWSGDDRERIAVQWEAIEVSPDRWTVTVVTSYPLEGFCAKEPDGIEVTTEGSVATVTAWMAGPTPRDGLVCTADCGRVTQAVTLDEPLAESIERFEPVPGAVQGCWS